jgi:hypothetical protein
VEAQLIIQPINAVAAVEAQDTMAAVAAARETARIKQVVAEEVLTLIPYW